MSSSCGLTEIVLEGEAANDVYALLSHAKEVTHELMGIVWFLKHYAGYEGLTDDYAFQEDSLGKTRAGTYSPEGTLHAGETCLCPSVVDAQ